MKRITKDDLIKILDKKETELSELKNENLLLKRENTLLAKYAHLPADLVSSCRTIVEAVAHIVGESTQIQRKY